MSRVALLLPVALGLAACTNGPVTELRPGDKAQIEEVVQTAAEQWSLDLNGHDIDALLGHYLQTEDFVYVGITEVAPGFDAYASRARVWNQAKPDVTFQHEIMNVHALDHATATVVTRGTSSEGETITWSQVWTLCEDGVWRIALEHESWPQCVEPAGRHPG